MGACCSKGEKPASSSPPHLVGTTRTDSKGQLPGESPIARRTPDVRDKPKQPEPPKLQAPKKQEQAEPEGEPWCEPFPQMRTAMLRGKKEAEVTKMIKEAFIRSSKDAHQVMWEGGFCNIPPILPDQCAEQLLGDVEFFCTITDEHCKGVVEQIPELEAAITSKDWNEVREKAHYTKGACANLYLEQMKYVAWGVESLGKALKEKREPESDEVTLTLTVLTQLLKESFATFQKEKDEMQSNWRWKAVT